MAQVAGFVAEVHRRFGMRPVVPLDFPIEIGDIGRIGNDGTWLPISTVRHDFRSFPGRVRQSGNGGVWELSSGDDVSFRLYERGEVSDLVPATAHAKTRAEITFRSRQGFVLAAGGVTIRTATDMRALIDKIHLAYHTRRERPEDGRWYKEHAFVFEVADAKRFTALLPATDGARIAITPRGTAGPPSTPAKLATLVRFGAGAEDVERTNQRDARGRFYRAYKLRPEVLARWREEPWSRARGVISFKWATPSFDDTFAEV